MKPVMRGTAVLALFLALSGCVLIGQTIGERRMAELLIVENGLLEKIDEIEAGLDGEPIDVNQRGILRGERVHLRHKLQKVRDELRQLELHWDLDRRDIEKL